MELGRELHETTEDSGSSGREMGLVPTVMLRWVGLGWAAEVCGQWTHCGREVARRRRGGQVGDRWPVGSGCRWAAGGGDPAMGLIAPSVCRQIVK